MSPTLSTPASPTPLTEDGDDLLLELRGFLSRMSGGAGPATDPRQAVSAGVGTGYRPQYARDTSSALRLLRHLPASRHAVFEYIAGVLDVAVAHHLIRYYYLDLPATSCKAAVSKTIFLFIALQRRETSGWRSLRQPEPV